MASLTVIVAAIQLVAASLFKAVCLPFRFSWPVLVLTRELRRWRLLPAALMPAVLHVDEITSQTLSDILGRPIVLAGTQPLGDGKMSSIIRVSYIELDGADRLSKVKTRHLICKSPPVAVGQALMSSIFGLHHAEIAALRRARLSPHLHYAAVHWTGQYLMLIDFVAGTMPAITTGVQSVSQIDAFVAELARFHKETIHFGLDDPEWRRATMEGNGGPVVSLLQKYVFSLVWATTSRPYNPPEIEERRSLIELGLRALSEIQMEVTKRYPTVLAHGDLHCANIIVGGDGRVCLVDWQASCVRPLFYDLCYFMGTSVPIKLRQEHMGRWLRLYLNEIGLGHVPDKYATECFAVCLYSLLVPLQFMAFLIKSDSNNGRMQFEATGRRALAMLAEYKTEERLRYLLDSKPNHADLLRSWTKRPA